MAVQAQYPSHVLLPDWRNKMRQLFGGENRNFISSTALGPTAPFLEDLQLQTAPPAVPNQLQLFTAFPGPLNDQQHAVNAAFNDTENELACNMLGSRKRAREADELVSSHRQQFATIPIPDYLQNQRSGCISVSQPSGGVSTGLRLSFDDERLSSSAASTSGRAEIPSIAMILGECLTVEIRQQRDEIDQLVKMQGEQLRQTVEEKRQRHLRDLFTVIEEGVSKKLREKEMEVDKVTRRNMELEERLNQLSLEAHVWQSKAKCNESMVTALRSNLQQAVAQSRELSREGCGDSEADDAASSHHGENGDMYLRTFKENKDLKEQRTCRVCRNSDVCMLLLPCRHLCLCKECEGRLDVCPLCRSIKSASVQIYMSRVQNITFNEKNNTLLLPSLV